ncbi:MAG: tetratricopeptide repeat protein [Candidatus Cloacimonetes bacterium]|jgi:tetratricopeptide (TPR) repeat protein|nr:tetratricopeptide repeat protein [Candidatus Cloacimonadota bacterium]
MIVIFLSVFAQTAEIDSLKAKVEKATGREKIDAVNLLSKAYWGVDPSQTLKIGKETQKLASELNYKPAEAKAISNIGIGYYYMNEYEKALEYLERSLKIRRKIGRKEDIIEGLNNIGIVYGDMNEHTLALKYFLESMEIESEN